MSRITSRCTCSPTSPGRPRGTSSTSPPSAISTPISPSTGPASSASGWGSPRSPTAGRTCSRAATAWPSTAPRPSTPAPPASATWAPSSTTPRDTRALFKHLVDSGLKGSGDYGLVALGVYNGQGVNEREANQNRHVVARLAVPFRLGSQILELAAGGYLGKFHPRLSDQAKTNGTKLESDDIRDARVHASFVLYPQPFGIQGEFTVGEGPELSGDPTPKGTTATVSLQKLYGGYLQLMYRHRSVIFFARGQLYNGGRKADDNAPRGDVREVEGGVEWTPFKLFELTATYGVGRRASTVAPYQDEKGRILRLQAQFNY